MKIVIELIVALASTTLASAQEEAEVVGDYKRPCGKYECRVKVSEPLVGDLYIEGGYFDVGGANTYCGFSATLNSVQPGVWSGPLDGNSTNVDATFAGNTVFLTGTQNGCAVDYGTRPFAKPGEKPMPEMLYRR